MAPCTYPLPLPIPQQAPPRTNQPLLTASKLGYADIIRLLVKVLYLPIPSAAGEVVGGLGSVEVEEGGLSGEAMLKAVTLI